MKKLLLYWIILSGIIFNSISAQPHPIDSAAAVSRVRYLKYSLIIGSVGMIGLEYLWWWNNDPKPFRVHNAGWFDDYSLGVDKVGHIYSGYVIYHVVDEIARWSGVDPDTRKWLTIGVPVFHAVTVEFGDAFSKFNFDPGDLAANFMGVGFGLLQDEVPFFENIKLKFSYYPSGIVPLNSKWDIASDYDGHIYWAAFRMHRMLPKSVSDYWPRWLNVAVGYSGMNLSHGATDPKLRKFAIGFDIELSEFTTQSDTWQMLLNIGSNFRFPAPGVRFVEEKPVDTKLLLVN